MNRFTALAGGLGRGRHSQDVFLLKEQIERAQNKRICKHSWAHLSVLATWKKVAEVESPHYPQVVIMWPLKLQWFALLLGEKDGLWTTVLWAGIQTVPRGCLLQPSVPKKA